ncbi:protein CASC3 isoform X2 [Polyodon spathula]|uniref:protein CASC3 isoform X2 n=1 Tax=Polyodon spathula TaxID=7913 RepID=UPI001B7DDE43|nr:protein CASC3 isoform X2 [Polyodon spathula]
MADRRRRRKRASQDSEDEDESGSGTGTAGSGSAAAKNGARVPEPVAVPPISTRVKADREDESECESEDGIEGDVVLSDYESAEENGSRSEAEEEEEGQGGGEEFSQDETPELLAESKPVSGEQGGAVEETEAAQNKEEKAKEKTLAGERQSGDGQESTESPESKPGDEPGNKLDDDEDRKNPAYIPRKGLFFEHDVRGAAQEEDMRPKGRHKKLWKDEGRWVHDKFREEEQAPKSREELVSMYGYDIRHANGPSDLQPQRCRKPRYTDSPLPGRDKRWHDAEKPNRIPWHSGTTTTNNHPPPPSSQQQHGAPQSSRPYGASCNSTVGSGRISQQPRTFQNSRTAPSNPSPSAYLPHREGRTNFKPAEQHVCSERERARNYSNNHRTRSKYEPRCSPNVVVEEYQDEGNEEGEWEGRETKESYCSRQPQERDFTALSRRKEEEEEEQQQQQQQQEEEEEEEEGSGGVHPDTAFPARDQGGSSSPLPPSPTVATERTVEKKSYSRARRTRNKASEIGKQASVEEPLPPLQLGGALPDSAQVLPPQKAQLTPTAHPAVKAESWEPPLEGVGGSGGGGGLEHEMACMNLSAQRSWTSSQPPYIPGEMRGIPNQMHMGAAPHQYTRIDEMGVGVGRAKRYSSQRQRPVPEPTAMHIGIMEGHYYDPRLHPHQPPAPLPNPGLYAGPPVSMSPGQPPPGPLLAPAYYSPPGVMTFSNTNFSYPAGATLPPMYPNPQVYGGVTYYSTVQQQAQSKPSPPRRTSQPVSIKPPPPEGPHLLPE